MDPLHPSGSPPRFTVPIYGSDEQLSPELAGFLHQLGFDNQGIDKHEVGHSEEVKTTPMFTLRTRNLPNSNFEQYALLGGRIWSDPQDIDLQSLPLFLNTNAPWSAFICGSQGSGKSYTLSCMLENCLVRNEELGKMEKPMHVMLFNYDNHSSGAPCEAAYLASQLPVTVLVSPTYFWQMKQIYQQIPTQSNIRVVPLLLEAGHLNIERILSLMSVNVEKGAPTPLYIKAVKELLQEMAMDPDFHGTFDYEEFKDRLTGNTKLTTQQKEYLDQRLRLLDAFMKDSIKKRKGGDQIVQDAGGPGNIFASKGGSLTIVDLSSPFLDGSEACLLFDICLSIFLQNQTEVPRVVALDEAHKFLTDTFEAEKFTRRLETVIREQRHLGARVMIATQEPTISTSLLDLCSMTIVHRFSSPAWMKALQDHLAGASSLGDMNEENAKVLLKKIAELKTGQALLFSPSAMLNVQDGKASALGLQKIKFKTRLRITKDGGHSLMAAKGSSETAWPESC